MRGNLITLEEAIRSTTQRRHSQRVTNVILIPPNADRAPAMVIGRFKAPGIFPIFRINGKLYTDADSIPFLKDFTQGTRFIITESLEEFKSIVGNIPDFRMNYIEFLYNHPEKFFSQSDFANS